MSAPQIGAWTKNWAEKKGIHCRYFQSIASTNSYSKAFDFDLHENLLVVTEHQTGGRGRGSNTWVNAEAGASLLCTFSLPVKQAPQPIASPLIGLEIYKAAKSTWPQAPWSIKAPNDLYIKNDKIAGLLLETSSQGTLQHRLHLGLGMNIFSHPQIAQSGSLQSHLSKAIVQNDCDIFLSFVWSSLTAVLVKLSQKELSPPQCQELCLALNNFSGLVDPYLGVLPNGSLKTRDGVIDWTSL